MAAKLPRKIDLEHKLQEAGFCCTFGWCGLTQQKATRGHKRTKAKVWALKLGVSQGTIFNARRKYDAGELQCQGLPNCQKGLVEPTKAVEISIQYPGKFVLAAHDEWLITFRDFPEVKEYASPRLDKFKVAAMALEVAIDARIRVLRVVPAPSRAAEGERLIEVPEKVASRMMDYKKFFLLKNPEKEREY